MEVFYSEGRFSYNGRPSLMLLVLLAHSWCPRTTNGANLATASVALPTGCPAEFLGRCRCGPVIAQLPGQVDAKRYVTNCSDSGFRDASVLRQLPPETEVLVFTGNAIGRIPPNVFGDEARYDRLIHIDMSRNNVTEIQGQAFHRVPNVRCLILDNNAWRIDVNHTRIFANMKALDELHLDRALDVRNVGGSGSEQLTNLIRLLRGTSLTKLFIRNNRLGPYLKMDVFCEVPSLAEIYLDRNEIVQVMWIRQCLSRLHTLDLRGNLLRFLSNGTMDKLDAIADLSVDLSDNDFDCDCRMLAFYEWVLVTNVHVQGREGYTCKDGYPESNAGHLIMTLPSELYQCQEPNSLLLVPSFAFVHAVLGVVIVLICVLLLSVAIAHRNSIANTFRRVGEPVYRRMQYSTIQKQAERELEV